MTFLQLLENLGWRYPTRREQDKCVIGEVGYFGNQTLIVLRKRGDHDLRPLLPHFLGDPGQAVLEQAGGLGFLGRVLSAIFDHIE
jgi:hypothetical protein